MTTRWYGVSDPSNMKNFTVNSYNLTGKGSWCVKNNSIYTNAGAKFNYFNKNCGDPYTYYNFWYRRFPSQRNYLNCYNLPYVDPLLKNQNGYIPGSKTCQPFKNFGYNQVDNGFKYFDRKINYTSP